jgi:multicomponent Na+:H+ antiporter subunit B
MISLLDGVLLALAVATAVALLALRDLLGAVVAFGAFSFFSALFFASLGALDVAFTEAAVGAAITTVLFVALLCRTEQQTREARRPRPAAAVVSAVALAAAGFVLLRAVWALPPVGDPASPPATHVSPRYVERGPAETGADNMVTAVLADYRSFDTLGETVVVLAAGIGCAYVLAGARADGEQG